MKENKVKNNAKMVVPIKIILVTVTQKNGWYIFSVL